MYDPQMMTDNGDKLPNNAAQVIGDNIAQIAALLMVHHPNFIQGNPVVFNVPTDVRDVEIRVVISLGQKGKLVPRIARIQA